MNELNLPGTKLDPTDDQIDKGVDKNLSTPNEEDLMRCIIDAVLLVEIEELALKKLQNHG